MVAQINKIVEFLACRDLPRLTETCLKQRYRIQCADAVMVFGNELTETVRVGAKAVTDGLADYLIICGGIGHSTEILRNNVAGDRRYEEVHNCIAGKSEAEILGMLAEHYYGVTKERILLDTSSSNTGENAKNGLELLRERNSESRYIILIQDPLMQRRSKVTLENLTYREQVISFAPFLPRINGKLSFENDISCLWKKERFLEVMLGEISRLRDDERGYGPKGKGFISHVDIPEEVLEAYEYVKARTGGGSRNLF